MNSTRVTVWIKHVKNKLPNHQMRSLDPISFPPLGKCPKAKPDPAVPFTMEFGYCGSLTNRHDPFLWYTMTCHSISS
jgi:hypothetical protein